MASVFTLEPDFGLRVEYQYNNTIKRYYKGDDYCNAQWIQPLALIDFSNAYFEQSVYDYVNTFYQSVNSGQDTFLFTDPLDYEATNIYYDTTEGLLTRGEIKEVNGQFQLVKRYVFGSGAIEFGVGHIIRPITRPNVSSIQVYDTLGNPQTVTIDPDTGRVTGGGVADNWRWSGEFYLPVRFINERVPIELLSFDEETNDQLYSLPDLQLKEVREDSLAIIQDDFQTFYDHLYSLPIEYGNSLDFTFKTDVYEATSGHSYRDDLVSNRRGLSFSHTWLDSTQTIYLIGLWRMCLGNFSAFRFTDTEAGLSSIIVRFNEQLSFETLACDQDDVRTFAADAVEVIQELNQNKTTLCHTWEITKKDGTVIYATDHDQPFSIGVNLYDPSLGLSTSSNSNTAELNTDSVDTVTVFASGLFTEEEVLSNQLNNINIVHRVSDWQAGTNLRTLFNGYVGTYSIGYKGTTGKQYSFESLSLNNRLNSKNAVNVSSKCPYEFLSQGTRKCNRTIDTSVRQTDTIASATQTEITLTTLNGNDYKLGTIQFDSGPLQGQKYFIGNSTVNSVLLMLPLGLVPANGTAVTLTRGCAKDVDACSSYNNLPNYGGFPQLMGGDLSVTPPNS